MTATLVDSHCHLHMLEPGTDHPEPYLDMAARQGVGHFLTVSVDLDSFPGLLKLAENYPQVSTSVGVHPCGKHLRMVSPAQLAAMADHPKVLAIGETGLDYLCIAGPEDHEWQHQRFRDQIRAARLAEKPLIIHSRQAPEDTARILREEGADSVGGIIHCFTENWKSACAFMDLGFHISLSGILTFQGAGKLRKVAKRLPRESLLVETDCPYLAPAPYRGRQNQPAFVREVAACLAEVRGEALEGVAEYTTDNFYRLFPAARHFQAL
ncbi:MAG: TatD family hydrolase [Ectothiorhodospiraceae bacterium]|nr:TatD family hydrolase [Paracoccaceae bacterium]MCH8505095.1 TatD family hydrolase [Ectothiorhodospiraceae bacterium]